MYRVMSRSSSIRVATESRMERAEVAPIALFRPRARNSAARGASRRGALTISWPGFCTAKPSIQPTDVKIW